METEDIRYSTEHMWVRIEDDHWATIGLSEEALQDQAGISRVKLPGEGDELIKDEAFGRLTTEEKAVFRLYAPMSGDVTEVNEEVLDMPDLLLEDPYDEGWLLKIEFSNQHEFDDLMTRDEYYEFLGDGALDDDDLDEDEDDLDDDLEDDEDEEDELDF